VAEVSYFIVVRKLSEFDNPDILAEVLIPDVEGPVFSVAREKALEYIRLSKSWKEFLKRIDTAREAEENDVTLIALNYLRSKAETVYAGSKKD
jgi:hypothetical protein